MVIATLAGGNDIHPAVLTALAQGVNMIPGKQKMWKLLAAIQTQVLITAEQRLIAQRGHIACCEKVFVGVLPQRGNDGIDADHALKSADGIDAAMDLVERFSERVTDLVKRD